MKQRASILARFISGDDDERSKLDAINDYFYKLTKPKVFWNVDGQLGEEAKYDKGFETSCVIMSQHISRDPKAMTTQEYLQTLEELRNQQRSWEQKNGRSNGKH